MGAAALAPLLALAPTCAALVSVYGSSDIIHICEAKTVPGSCGRLIELALLLVSTLISGSVQYPFALGPSD
jgi:hypothetical protein